MGLAVAAAAVFLTPLKGLILGPKPTPPPKVVVEQPTSGGEKPDVRTPTAGPSQMPTTIILDAMAPKETEIYFASVADSRVRVYPEETSGRRRSVQLSDPKNEKAQDWIRQNGNAKEWRLEFEAPRFDKVAFNDSPAKIVPSTSPEVEFEKAVALRREQVWSNGRCSRFLRQCTTESS